MKRSALALCALVLAACAGAQRGAQRDASLRVIAVPDTASVSVNERFVGAARVLDKRPVALTRGPKRVTVEAPGYFPHDLDVSLAPGVTTVQVKLRPVPR